MTGPSNRGNSRRGMSVVLRVIVIATVLIILVMALVFVGGQGLDQFKFSLGETKSRESARIKCKQALQSICNAYPESAVLLRYTADNTGEVIEREHDAPSGVPLKFGGRKCADVLGVADTAYYDCVEGQFKSKISKSKGDFDLDEKQSVRKALDVPKGVRVFGDQ